MGILQEFETIFNPEITAIEQFGKSVESDVLAWLKAEETVVIDDAKAIWGVVKTVLTKVGASQWTILTGLAQTAAKDLAAGDVTGIATAILAQAEAQELAWVASLGPEFLAIVAALETYNPASALTVKPSAT